MNHRLLKRGEKVLVAVSGGLDSMVLLQLLRQLSVKHQWQLFIAHFNHQLRGRSSDADEKLVRQIAAKEKLPFFAGRADVKRFARQSKLSIEMAARKLRHEFFARIAKQHGIRIIALAHHADDQVELFFLRLLRGAGGEGLAGMKWRSPSPADKALSLIRPLLACSKNDLRAFAQKNKIAYREDATNATFTVPRNRIRNELLPLLRRHYQPALDKNVLRLMEIIGGETDLIGEDARLWLERKKPSFARLPLAVQRRVLHLQLTQLGVPVDFELVENLRKNADLPFSIGPQLSVRRDEAGKIVLHALEQEKFNAQKQLVKITQSGRIKFGGAEIGWRLMKSGNVRKSFQTGSREFFDADKIGSPIRLRHWQPGDRFQPIGMKSAVKLQDLFTNAKIPRAKRHGLVVAEAADGRIFWVEGLRIGEGFKLTAITNRVLKITCVLSDR